MTSDNAAESARTLIDQTHSSPQRRVRMRQREIEQLQDIIIRAHYLSMELRDICANSNIGSREMSLAAGHMIKAWALSFAAELDRAATSSDSP